MKTLLYPFRLIFLASLLYCVFHSYTSQAQQLGLASSNYAGTHSLYTNPAFIADSRHAFYLGLFSVESGALNNYLRYEGPVSLFKLVKDELEFEDRYLKENLNGKPKFMMANVDVRGPSFMLSLSPKHSVAFTSRVRGAFQGDNISEDLARLYKVQKGEAEDFVDKASANNTMNLNANMYSELGFSYARILLDKQNHFLKGGFTVKKLAGGYSAYLLNEDTRFKIEERPVTGTDTNEDVLLIDRINVKYGYITDDAIGDLEASDIAKMLTGQNSPGKGWGADLGFSYEYRPNYEKYHSMMDGAEVIDKERNKYKYRISISLMDVGGIDYDNAAYVKAYNIEKQNRELKLSDFEGAEDTEEIAKVINNALGVTDADKKTSFRSGLPTALNLNLDYNVVGPLYVNAIWLQDLRGKGYIGMRQNSLVALTPRLEFRKFEASFPVAIQHEYSVVTLGAMVRFFNFFVGSDNIAGVFNIGDTYGASIYAGVSFLPLLKRNKKDKDKDGVSNKKDKCKKVPGTLEMQGCPDADNDGVADVDDACPDIPGSIQNGGCTDPSGSQ